MAERYRNSNRGTGIVFQSGGGSYDYKHCLDCPVGRENLNKMQKENK